MNIHGQPDGAIRLVDDQDGITATILLLALAPTVLDKGPADEGIFLKY